MCSRLTTLKGATGISTLGDSQNFLVVIIVPSRDLSLYTRRMSHVQSVIPIKNRVGAGNRRVFPAD